MDKAKHIILKSHMNENLIEVGLDEAGRGALAGPVVVAAVIMPKGFTHPLIKDSKLLNEGERKEARKLVLDNAISYSIKAVDVDYIEKTNILKATLHGMKECLDGIKMKGDSFEFILVDGDQFHGWNGVPFETVVGGDNKYTSIAAASILAKTSRDLIMKQLNEGHEQYGWNSNKGYGTSAHRNAIKKDGATEHHRMSFISHMLTTTNSLF